MRVIRKTDDLDAYRGGLVKVRLSRADGETSVSDILHFRDDLLSYVEQTMRSQDIATAEFLNIFDGSVMATWRYEELAFPLPPGEVTEHDSNEVWLAIAERAIDMTDGAAVGREIPWNTAQLMVSDSIGLPVALSFNTDGVEVDIQPNPDYSFDVDEPAEAQPIHTVRVTFPDRRVQRLKEHQL